MKILVTGGSGFIGSQMVIQLNHFGHDVWVLDSSNTNQHRSNLIQGDITDRSRMLELIPQFDCVYHLAGVLGTSELNDHSYEAAQINMLGAINIFDGALINKTQVINIGKPNVWLNTYSITKEASEKFASLYFKEHHLPITTVKWFNVYGPGQSFHCQKAVPFFIKWALNHEPLQLWGDGEQTGDFIYLSDAVKATLLIASKPQLFGHSVEVGTGTEISINRLANLIIQLSHSRSVIRHFPMRSGEDENTKLKADTTIIRSLGFKPEWTIESGLRETINWYRKISISP